MAVAVTNGWMLCGNRPDRCASFTIVTIDSTMTSNVAVGPPIDILCYEKDSLEAKLRAHLKEDDAYLQTISDRWQDGIVKLVNEMPAPDFSKPALGFATAA